MWEIEFIYGRHYFHSVDNIPSGVELFNCRWTFTGCMSADSHDLLILGE